MVANVAMRTSRVVIVGAGFGGLSAARSLAGAPFDVVLIDRYNHHLFQPLLYQVATAALSPADIASPIRTVFHRQHNVSVVLANVSAIDAGRNEVIADGVAAFGTGPLHDLIGLPLSTIFAGGSIV
ncbi:MAG TPA: FAD-dependent oxidoreductase, partial [Pseudolabrys sp.]|nr:FAD-dependent oxidoreductase [Pseudolabrys sp.]